MERIKEKQLDDPQLGQIRGNVLTGEAKDYMVSSMGLLRYKDWICVSMDAEIRQEILDESHTTPCSLHQGTTKMYQDLRTLNWLPRIKRDVTEYVAKCLMC